MSPPRILLLTTYAVFFLSGISGLVYQVVWVRVFGGVFGNTVYSAALVTAVFMAGLGFGSYVIGRLGDRAFARKETAPLLLYGLSECLIALWCLGLAILLPELGPLSAATSSYVQDAQGWYQLSLASRFFQGLMAVVLLAPPAFLMGGTLSLLIRFTVGRRLASVGWQVSLLYGLNTLGAALGCFLTDFSLVPSLGIFATQLLAAAINGLAGLLAMILVWRARKATKAQVEATPLPAPQAELGSGDVLRAARLVALALFLAGFAAMGMELVWFRFLISLLGAYRSVFSLLLTVILLGIFAGALLGGWCQRRWGRPGTWFMGAQALFAASALGLLAAWDGDWMAAHRAAMEAGAGGTWLDTWSNLKGILLVTGLPSLCMGFTFPLGNAIAQRTTARVGRRAGSLYLANTGGNIAGSLAGGFLFLPVFGVQVSASFMALLAAASMLPVLSLQRASAGDTGELRRRLLTFVGFAALAGAGFLVFALQGSGRLVEKSFQYSRGSGDYRVLAVSEGSNETVVVTEDKRGYERVLHTNGHPMTATGPMAQRYMRAFVHLPLLHMDEPRAVLVICFGVGNTLHAASLHRDLMRLEVVDLSRNVLEHANYFKRTNHGVLEDPRTRVFINDGRHHLQMQPEDVYDLITLEPPPPAHAGVSALYSREFYRLARARLREGGFMSQWLPAHQMGEQASLKAVRAFIEVFPQAILLNGALGDQILLGRKGQAIQLTPEGLLTFLQTKVEVATDLRRHMLGSPVELVGTFVASPETLRRASEGLEPLSDDKPSLEYAIDSRLNELHTPAALFVPRDASSWCPACFSEESLAGAFADLPAYLKLMEGVYRSERFLIPRLFRDRPRGRPPFEPADRGPAARKAVLHSVYLRMLLGHPDKHWAPR